MLLDLVRAMDIDCRTSMAMAMSECCTRKKEGRQRVSIRHHLNRDSHVDGGLQSFVC